MAYSRTIDALEKITDFANFERLCCDLLSCYKYEGIVPRGIGKIDDGIDAVLVERFDDTVTSVLKKTVFHFSTRQDYENKLYEDLDKTGKHNPTNVVFVTNRRIGPLQQDRIINDVKTRYGWDLIICDQEWLRIPLDTSYQNIGRFYLGIEFDLTVFETLDYLLENKNRYPNREDFENNRFYWNKPTHISIHRLLEEKRMCLIKGKPGSGKTSVARGIGYTFSKENPKNIVLYMTANNESSCSQWLSQIQRDDYSYVLYIIDNCHAAIEAVNELIERWHRVRNAKILLISRSINPDLTGPSDINYLRILEDDGCVINSEITVETIVEIIRLNVPLYEKMGKQKGDIQKILEKCEGDLHLLDYFIIAWIKETNTKALSEIEEDEILDDVYRRYLYSEVNPEYVLKICTLWQFEIPVQFDWLCTWMEINSIQQDAFIEHFVSQDYGGPICFLRYFHSTPANYLLKSFFKKGALRGQSIADYTKKEIKDYLLLKPANFFDVFSQLYINGGEELEYQLFSDAEVFTLFKEMIKNTNNQLLMNRLHKICGFLRAVWRWEGKRDRDRVVSYNLLQYLIEKIGHEGWHNLFESPSYHHIISFRLIGRIDKDFTTKFIHSLNFKKLAQQEDIGLAVIINLFGLAKQAGVDSDKLNAFCEGLDFKALGERSRDLGLATVKTFLELAKRAGVDSDKLKVFCEGLDFKALGERSRDLGLATVMTFLQLTKQTGVDNDKLNIFCKGLDFKALGEQSRDVGLATVMNFLKLTRQAGISETILKSFCEALDWKSLGEAVGKKIRELKNPFFELHSVQSYSFISKDMALLFIEGISLTTLNKAINEHFSPDILAASIKLLVKKCGLLRNESAERRLDLNPYKTWLNSFINNPCPKVEMAQQSIQKYYLNYAGTCFAKFAERDFEHKSSIMPLKAWNILIHNMSAACHEYLEEKIIPLIKDFSIERLEELLDEADLSNISIFLSNFNPKDGPFKWSITKTVNFKRINFLEKLEDSTLTAISHFLFNFYFINKGECSHFFAEQLDRNYLRVMSKIKDADIAELDFFFWNFWMAMSEEIKPRIFGDELIIGIILEQVRKGLKDKESLLGLIGTLNLSMSSVPQEFIDFITAEKVKSICKRTSKTHSIKFIRLLGGSLLFLSKDDINELYQNVAEQDFQYHVHVPNQIEALRFIRSECNRGHQT